MTFSATDQHIVEYYHHGYTVFRGVIEPSLLDELRLAGEEVERLSYGQFNVKVSRSPSIKRMWEALSPRSRQAFTDYEQYAPLRDAIHKVLTPRHTHTRLVNLALFLTEKDGPIVQDWHRDMAENYPGVDNEEFARVKLDPQIFTQYNCALYTDQCLWYVPGSAGRKNTQSELDAAGPPYGGIEGRGRILNAELEGKSYAERERRCLAHCQSMPNAVNLVLEGGDYAVYRPLGWHTGYYAPHRKRLTLHDWPSSPELVDWYERRGKRMQMAT